MLQLQSLIHGGDGIRTHILDLGKIQYFFLPPNSVQIYGHFWGLFFIFWMLLVAILTWFKSMDIFGGFLDAVTPVTCPWWRRDSNPHSGLGQNSIFFLPP